MRIPGATYRLQFNSGFTFRDADGILDYLHELGITDIYASPVFTSRKGSRHGYDVVNQSEINPELGGEGMFISLSSKAAGLGLGWIQDIVPNHMAYTYENAFIRDVLENGRKSQYAAFFDINWEHYLESIKGRILAPFLGGFFGDTLEKGEIKLAFGEDGVTVNYYEKRFPLKPESQAKVFEPAMEELALKTGRESEIFIKFSGAVNSLKHSASVPGEDGIAQERFSKIVLWELYGKVKEIKDFIDACIKSVNGSAGDPDSFNELEKILTGQNYRLCFSKVAAEEINYRRFFNINELVSMAIEDKTVFEKIHELVLRLAAESLITGLRVDHIDGLYDPEAYLKELREKAGPVYIVTEKILERNEKLPGTWPVEGTTGYDYLNFQNGIFCIRENAQKAESVYRRFSRLTQNYGELLTDKKRLIIGRMMAGDVENLAQMMIGISGKDRYGIDITGNALKQALVEVLAFFPVYRTYISEGVITEQDKRYIESTIKKAEASNPGLRYEIEFIKKFLLPGKAPRFSENQKRRAMDFVKRFQQLTGPLTAKGFEDTVLYIFNRLVSLNEVGSNPGDFGVSTREFHSFNEERAVKWPHSMSATATHDTKRGEDSRARINVLSELPDEWEKAVRRWTKINARPSKILIDKNDEYLLYQTLLGTIPFEEPGKEYSRRIKDYMLKAMREAKVHTEWTEPDKEYEDSVLRFIDRALDRRLNSDFWEDFYSFAWKISFYGVFNSISQMILKVTCPGVPDYYQGTELWDFSLVDPDNRRPVDFDKRKDILREFSGTDTEPEASCIKYLKDYRSGKIKMFLIYRLLKARSSESALFSKGNYEPIEGQGVFGRNLIAFSRSTAERTMIVVVPRFLTRIAEAGIMPLGKNIWKDTGIEIADTLSGTYADKITGRKINTGKMINAADVFDVFPGAVLMRE